MRYDLIAKTNWKIPEIRPYMRYDLIAKTDWKKFQQKSQNHYSNLTSKIMKMCEHIFKKRQRPNTIQNLWIVKNQEHRNIARLSLQLRSYNKKVYKFQYSEFCMNI